MKIGKIIKGLRGKMTQAELAKKAGLNFTTISKLEKGSLTGSITTHRKIASALGITLSELYQGLDETRLPILEISSQKKPLTDIFYYNKKVISQMLLSQVAGHKMLPELIRLEKRGLTDLEQKTRDTEQFIFIVEGKIEIRIGERVYQLKKGRSIYFDASLPNRIKNLSSGPARVLRVTTPAAL